MNRALIILFSFLFSHCKPDKDEFVKSEFSGYNQKIEMYVPDSLKLYSYDTIGSGLEKAISYSYIYINDLKLNINFKHIDSNTFDIKVFFDNCINRQNALNVNTVWLEKSIITSNNHDIGLLEYSSKSFKAEGYIIQAYIEENGILITVTYQFIGRKEDLEMDLFQSIKTVKILH